MGTSHPRFWYYPDPDGAVEHIDLGEDLSDLQEMPVRSRSDALTGFRSPRFLNKGGGYQVRIVLERFADPALERALLSMQAHLERGGRVGFSAVASKAFAGYSTGGLNRGDSALTTSGNEFSTWLAVAALSAGDEVAIETANPEMIREFHSVSSVVSGRTINFDGTTIIYNNTTTPSMIRYRDFYPALYMPQEGLNKPIVTHDHRIAWTLDMTLQVDPGLLALGAASEFGGGKIIGLRGSSVDRGLGSLDRILGNLGNGLHEGGSRFRLGRGQ